jgi:prostaglandin-endoperoxide synthase 2
MNLLTPFRKEEGFNLSFDPTEFFDFKFEEKFHHEENYLFHNFSMIPPSIQIKGKENLFENLLFKSIENFDLGDVFDTLMNTSCGFYGLNNTPDFLKNEEIKLLLHSRMMKTQSYVEYKKFFEGTDVIDFSDITRDESLQNSLKEIYKNVKNVDYYIGLLSEDHKDGISGDLNQFQFAIYLLSNIYSNPICFKKNWNEKTFTKFGFERIKSSNFKDIINRNFDLKLNSLFKSTPDMKTCSIPNYENGLLRKQRKDGSLITMENQFIVMIVTLLRKLSFILHSQKIQL